MAGGKLPPRKHGVYLVPPEPPVRIGFAAAGGVSDHGALTGLADDDHTQYAPDTDVAKARSVSFFLSQ